MNDSYRQCQANILKQTEPKIVHKSTKTDSYKHTLIIYYLSEAFSFPSLSFHLLFDSKSLVVQYLVVFFPLLHHIFPFPSSASETFPFFFSVAARQSQYYNLLYKTKTEKEEKCTHASAHTHTHAKTKVNKSLTAWFTEDARTEQQRKRNLENKKKHL